MKTDSSEETARLRDGPPGTTARQYCSGLVLEPSRPIPGLADGPPGAPVDVEVWMNDDPPWRDEPGTVTRLLHESPYRLEGRPTTRVEELNDGRWFRMSFFDDIDFVVDAAGTRIWATWADHQTLADATTYLVGPVVGFVLRRRGVTCLHASAVAIDGWSVAMVGRAGSGKSTTAAAFARAGFPVLSDDSVPLIEEGGRLLARPALPLIRLWAESAEALYGSAEDLPILAPNWRKRFVDLRAPGHQMVTEAMELGAIYLFGERRDDPKAPYVEAVPASSAFLTLVANTNATFLMDRRMRGEEFGFLTRVVRRVPIRRLHAHAGLDRLEELPRAIVEDFRAFRRHGA